MREKNVEIIFACNDNYVPYLAVTIQSIIAFANRNRVYNIKVLYTNIDEQKIKNILEMEIDNVSIKFVNVKEAISKKNLYTKHHISEETYYRGLVPELFPDLDKVLYIDCDLVMNRDIAELYDTDISNYMIAAVKNFSNQKMYTYIQKEIGIDPIEYFNAGVLLLNLHSFRENEIGQKFFAMAGSEKKYNLMDQDFLNILCNKRVLYLNPKWNVSWQHVFKNDDVMRLLDVYQDEYNEIIAEPYIIHYTTEKKPWDYKDVHLADYFWKYAKSNEIFMDDYEKKKILLVTHEMDYAGSEHSLKRICVILKKAGYKVDVWSYQSGDFANELKKINVQIRFINKCNLNTKEYIEQISKYSLVIANTVATYDVVNVAQDLVPTIWYIREGQNIPIFYSRNSRLYETLFKAYCIYTVSEYAAEFIKENYNPNVSIIHNCVDDEANTVCSKKKKSNEKIKLLTLGTIEERKGYDVYFRAYMALPKKYKDKLELHFAGRTVRWAQKYADDLFEEIKPYNGIKYHGEIQDRKILLNLINDVDVVVVASRDESCSLVALEGAMLSKPLLVTENVGAKYIVNENDGWIVKTGDIESMKEAYMKIVDSKNKLKEMGIESRKQYIETSTFEMLEEKILEMVSKHSFENSKQFITWKNESKKKLNPVDLINYPFALHSYDVFDTLITRMTATPKGIFALIQYKLNYSADFRNVSNYVKQNFYDLRMNAECCARNALITKKKEEVTLKEIYSALDMMHEMSGETIKKIKNLEMQLEYDVSVPIKMMVAEIEKKIKNKFPIICISDMYLEKAFIRKILHKASADISTQKIYTSSEYNKSKGTGNMFKYVKNSERIEYKNWQHIGDNEFSDNSVPQKFGIKTKLFSETYLTTWEKDLINNYENDAEMQLAVGAAKNSRINSDNKTIAYRVGASVGAISVYAYVRWLVDRAVKNNINRLYFVARDGYVLKKIADLIIAEKLYDIETKYIYGSRMTWRLPATYIDNSILDTIFKESLPHFITRVTDFAEIFEVPLNVVLKYLPNSFKEPDKVLDSEEVTFIKKVLMSSNEFTKYVCISQKEKYERVCAYMKQELDLSDDKFAFVELNGSGFTQWCLGTIMSSFYSGTIKSFFLRLNSVKKYESNKIQFYNYFPNAIKGLHLVEALCRAPHGQTYDYIQEKGIYYPKIEMSEGQALLEYGINDYMEGVVAFTNNMLLAEKQIGIKVDSCKLTRICLTYLNSNPAYEIFNYICDIPFGPTGREKKNSTFAPKLSDEQIKNIYLYKKKLQSVYLGSAFDISLKRCSKEQLEQIEIYKKNKFDSSDLTNKSSRKANKNYIADDDFALFDSSSLPKQETIIESKTNYDNTLLVKDGQLFPVESYIKVYNSNKKTKVLYSGQVKKVDGNIIQYDGKPIMSKAGDIVELNQVIIDKKEQTIWNSWSAYCNENYGKIVSMRTGILLIHPEYEKTFIFRVGTIMRIPDVLKGKNVTVSIACDNLVSDAEICLATSAKEIKLSSVGLNDDSTRIKQNGIIKLSTYIPENDEYMRIMLQISSKKYSQINIHKIKLEEGNISTLANSKKSLKKIIHIFGARAILNGINSLKQNGVHYILERTKNILAGKE